ncbi:MAG TPA: thioesterase family protein [Candidatus Polarisedimenticolaceae bacterium]|nr:thioesterase family protein [Candidatus Polarisedimenticolaceae bacterium]
MTRWAHEITVQATLRDTDGLGHVNNAVYLTWLEEVRTRYVAARRGFEKIEEMDFVLAQTTLNFRSPVYFHERVILRCAPTKVGNSSWALAYEGRTEDGQVVVEASSVQVTYDYATKTKAPIPAEWRRMLVADGAES